MVPSRTVKRLAQFRAALGRFVVPALRGHDTDRVSFQREATLGLSTGALRDPLEVVLGRNSEGRESGETKRRLNH
jgi:hypothetical protein